jgi:ABC-2 type transport system permease protein
MLKKQYLKVIWTLFKKEFISYFNSPIAYIFIAVFLIVGNWLFFQNFFLYQQASMRNFLSLLPWIFLFLAPALTMRLWAEERKSGTAEFLFTLPLTDWQAALAKFFGALAFVAVALLATITVPITVMSLGQVDLGPVIGGYLGALFLAGSYLAIGLFTSAITKNQIVAFIIGLAVCFGFFIIGYEFIIMTAPNWLAPTLSFIGLGNHFENVARGVIDTKDIIYYLSFIFLFLWLNVRLIGRRS